MAKFSRSNPLYAVNQPTAPGAIFLTTTKFHPVAAAERWCIPEFCR